MFIYAKFVLLSWLKVLINIFCVEFRWLSHFTRDLYQVEKKQVLLQAEQMDKMTYFSLKIVEFVILSENSCQLLRL